MLDKIISRRTSEIAEGFEVGRILPSRHQRMVGPFIFLDHMGPLDVEVGASLDLDVKPHPHIGLSTVTYLFSGAITHRDSLGVEQEIQPGEVNWMVAGRGITHSERMEYGRRQGMTLHGLQAWVALPTEFEEVEPAFHHFAREELPGFQSDGMVAKLIAGAFEGFRSPVPIHSPLFYVHMEMEPDASYQVNSEYSEQAVYIVSGQVELVDGTKLDAGQMGILKQKSLTSLHATQKTTLVLFGGEPVGERFIHWNFVSSSKERLEKAKDDWRHQRMKLPDGDDQAYVPLPER
ncbi:pirin family protein [Sneathiella limimaris]|uniref:pirin family protein n=1 Tax=Sneathiella limimaris TaxID=1964213 RepID=UPI00146B27C7|nr:pirin family protein [Sneathiella limimaris]